MTVTLKPLYEQVMVITGASSGIGLATARAAAKKGAKVVLASRNKEALEEIEQQIKGEGGQAIHVVADVGRSEDVQRIADAAARHFGGFDTWVNDAGVTIYGRLEEVSEEDSRRLFDTNFWGLVSGSLIAAQHLKTRGGAIINIGSVLSDVAIPTQGMYSASKHAVKGFTDALRIELEEDKAPVSVTLIKPSAINTPYTEHARNYTDKALTLPPPVYAPEEVANAILHAAEHPKRDIIVGGGGKAMSSTNKYAPGMMDMASRSMMTNMQLKDEPAQHHEGSLHQHGKDGKVHGNYDGHVMKTSLYTRASMHPVITSVVVAAASAAAFALLGKNNIKQRIKSMK
ncbi:SDR family oxidoreductase [Pontibacter akesuensis]|uniref:Short-chain dehydrogenase n=1 Tax=Pontibacter akesuensis TaxID=388950 RepID=A0A1I7JZJ2_9BACT|nr:SDR family oxidoreductase [Pontibacter akesuensis]GHA76247.1 glucose a-dehydrogenase YxnA [Pontibacter akesuensis]SFU90626.1 Short-chain dehydrogenase [Pontibacter akesuensis]